MRRLASGTRLSTSKFSQSASLYNILHPPQILESLTCFPAVTFLIPRPSSYLESSATAGFAYGMLHSLRKGYLKGDKYEAAALRSVKGIVERIAADGELADVRSVASLVFSLRRPHFVLRSPSHI